MVSSCHFVRTRCVIETISTYLSQLAEALTPAWIKLMGRQLMKSTQNQPRKYRVAMALGSAFRRPDHAPHVKMNRNHDIPCNTLDDGVSLTSCDWDGSPEVHQYIHHCGPVIVQVLSTHCSIRLRGEQHARTIIDAPNQKSTTKSNHQ